MSPRRRRWIGLAARVTLTAVALGLLLTRVQPGQVHAALGLAPAWVFLLPVGLMLINSAIHALRLRWLLLAAGQPAPFLGVWSAMLQSLFFGLALPTGGAEVVRLALLTRAGATAEATVAVLWIARLLELAPWGGLLAFGLARGLADDDPALGATAALFLSLFIGIWAATGLALRWGSRLTDRLPERIAQFLRQGEISMRQVRRDHGAAWRALLASFPYAFINCLNVWLIGEAFGLSWGYDDVLGMIPAADALISLPVTLSGVGVREGVFVHALARFGATEELAVAIALTRWTGELGRAAVGGLLALWGLSASSPEDPAASA